MNKKRYQKYVAQQRELNKDKVCEQCGKEHDQTYGTGRFCSKSCYKSFVASKHKGSEKCKAHLDKLRDDGIISKAKPYGTWKCEECNLIFETRNDLNLHLQEVHSIKRLQKLENGLFKCPYCNYIGTKMQAMGHFTSCKNHPRKEIHDLAHKQAGIKISKTFQEHPEKTWLGKHHSNSTKEKLSKIRAAQVQNEYLTNFHAKVKWYKVKNLNGDEYSVRGTWEVNVSKHLNDLGILWIKAKPIKYFKEYWHNYTADFYIPSLDVYVEVKGRYPYADREKMRLVCTQNPEKKIYFIHDKYFDFIDGKVLFDDNLLIQEKDI